MRAINFERGGDPKDTLQIGRKWQKVEVGDIVEVYFDIIWKDLPKGNVRVQANEEENDKFGRMFLGKIIEPKIISEKWAVTWSDKRKNWIII